MKASRLTRIFLALLILTLSALQAYGASKNVSDTFTGRGTRGPFMLTYQSVISNSEYVQVDGIHQTRQVDYLLDTSTGLLCFNKAIANGSNIYITYQCDEKATSRVGSQSSTAVNLMDNTNSTLQLNMTQKVASTGNLQVSSMGLSSKVSHGNSNLVSQFLIDPTGQSSGGADSSLNDKSAMQLSSSTGIGALKLTGNYAHVGSSYSNSAALGTAQGTQKTDLGAEWNLSKAMKLASSTSRVENLAGTDKGKVQTTTQHNLNYDYSKTGKFTAAMQEVQTKAANGNTVNTTQNVLKLAQNMGTNWNFALTNSHNATESGGSNTSTDVNQIDLAGKLAKNLDFSTTRAMTDSSANGQQVASVYNLKSTLAPKTTLAMKYSGVDNEKGADVKTTDLSLSTEQKTTALSAAFSQTDNSSTGSVTNSNVNMKVNLSDLSLTSGITRKDTDNVGTETGATMQLGTLKNKLKLTANMTQNEYLAKDSFYNTTYGMEIDPANSLKLNTTVTKQQSGSSDLDKLETGLVLTPSKRFKLSGSYQQQDTNTTQAIATTVSTETNPVDSLTLSGEYKNRQQSDNPNAPDTVLANLKYAPVKSVEITGDYKTNPEDATTAAVNQITQRLVGLKTTIGSLSLTGQYGNTQYLTTGQLAQTRQYGLALKLWSNTNFSAGLIQNQTIAGITANTYTLELKRNLGQDFSLSLVGKVVKDPGNSATPDDVTASAKLGIKF